MLVRLSVRMFSILILCPVLLAAGVQTLTIDSQLGTSIEDCFERISIGEQLPSNAIYRNVSELTTRECEQICKQDKQCQSYDYGVGAKGNATCDLGNLDEKELKGNLLRHPDYDIYVRRIGCEQSPPSPIQLDDPGDRPEPADRDPGDREPAHRPVFRPVDDKPDYLISSDLGPYADERPDDYTNPKPDHDSPPSYGSHTPQDIPYKPEKPGKPDSYDQLQFQDPYKPQRPGYVPEKPEYHYIVRPNRKPRPQDTGYGRPDPHGPTRPRPGYGQYASNYGQSQYEDNSIYLEINDPVRPYKPSRPIYTQGIYGYGSYSSQNSYTQDTQSHYSLGGSQSGYGNQKPKPQKPGYGSDVDDGYGSYGLKPQKPGYGSSTSDYGGYGSKPQKPGYSNPTISDGYGTKPQNPGYGSSTSDYDGYGSKPQKPGYGSSTSDYDGYGSKPQKPGYGSSTSDYDGYGSKPQKPGYGSSTSDYDSYGSKPQKPGYGSSTSDYDGYGSKPQKPGYGSSTSDFDGYGSKPQKPGYGSSTSDYDGYGSKPQKPGYGSSTSDYDGYGSKPQKPGYGSSSTDNFEGYGSRPQKPSYGSPTSDISNGYEPKPQKPGYGSSSTDNYGYRPQKPGYGSSNNDQTDGYGLRPQKPGYGSTETVDGYEPQPQKPYGGSKPPNSGYGSSSTDDNGYGSRPQKPGYGNPETSGGYGSTPQKPTYGSSTYYNSQSQHTSNQASYGTSHYYENRPQNHHDTYGTKPGNQGGYGNQGNYGGNSESNQGSYGSQSSNGYGNAGGYGSDQGSYGNQGSSNQGGYGSQGTYGFNQASYGSSQSSQSNRFYGSTHGNKPAYSDNQGSYGGNQGSYGGNQGSYGENQGSYGSTSNNKPSYGSDRPYQGKPINQKPQKPKPSYGTENDGYDNQGHGNRPYDKDRPDYVQPGNNNQEETSYGPVTPGYDEKPNKTSYLPDIRPVYEYEEGKPNAPSYIVRPNGEVITSRPMAVGDYSGSGYGRHPGKDGSYEACFRRVLAGRRALRSHVRKVAPCERLEDCRRECATEKRFPCESFNYRLDPSFRGKGLCELMTKPIEAFDLRRDFVEDKDFDFYELDRNSLEPNCPETLRGPGFLHSGFLSSQPDRKQGWGDRADWLDRDGDRFHGTGNRRHGDRFFVPYQINQGIARSNDDQENWGQYGGVYGGFNTYYKDRNAYHKSISHWRLDSDINTPSQGVKPHSNSDFDYNSLSKTGPWDSRYGGSWKRGRWNSAGTSNSLDYDSSFYREQSEFHESNGRSDEGRRVKDCSSRRRPGMSLGSGAIRRSLTAHSVVECEAACFNERDFKCVSYSYRYSNSRGSDNCFLSERPYRGLEMSADSSSDVYAMPQDQGCVTINYKPWVESECFWHVRSGAAVSDAAVRGKLTVGGLGACEAECIRAHAFFCRGFSFRFDSPTIGDDLENCVLTSSPPTSLENGRGLRANSGHELYSRGNYGRGCEPALYDDTQHKDEECYLQYDKAARLAGPAVRGQARVADERACGRACTEAPFRCLSFSYNNNAPSDTDNCLLSEIRLFDLQRGVDYVHSADDWLFAFDLFNGQCWRKVHGNSDYDEPTQELPRPISGPPEEDHYPIGPPSGPVGPDGPSGPSGPSGPEYIPIRPESPYIPGSSLSGPGYNKPYPTGPDVHGFKPGYSDHPPGFKPGYSDHPPGFKPGYSDHPPGFKPGYSDHPPGFKPGYSEHPPGFKPGYSDLPPGFKPGYSDHPPNFKPGYSDHPPGYQPYPSGPDFKPEDSEPSRPYPAEISGPDFKPGYPTSHFKPDYPAGDFKPDYPTAPSGPDFKPQYPVGPPRPDHKPGYPYRPAYKPSYPSPDLKPYPHENNGPYPESNFKPSYPSGPNRPGYPGASGPEYPADKPSRPDIKPGYRPLQPGRPGYRPGYPDRKPGHPDGQAPSPGVKPGYPDREVNGGIAASWRHYTVSGFPCRVGSACAQNQVAGHWACEPEGGEIGSWDYCCAPSHRCGYSEGFHKPWCYVGPTEDQWRPCSEKYYPYHQHKVPHPSTQGHKDTQSSHPRPWQGRPGYPDRDRQNQGPYLSEGDKKYWDELYKNGPQAYYDKYGNPLPGYTRVPTAERPQIKYSHNYPRPGGGQWLPVSQQPQEEPVPGLGVPRYWPVAYLHKGPPPNMTYFRYNETQPTTTTEQPAQPPTTSQSKTIDNLERNHRGEKKRNISDYDDITEVTTTIKAVTTEIPIPDIPKIPEKPEKERETPKIQNEPEIPVTEKMDQNKTNLELTKEEVFKDKIKGIDDKLDDFSGSIEIIDLDDIKGDKMSDLKTLEAEERQIEEIGRILASRRGGKLVLDRRSQKDLESKNIAVDKDFMDFNFGNRFNVERRGVIKKVSKDEIDRPDKSLEVSETTFVRPPRVLSTTENIRKAIVNGKVFYDATIREQRDVFLNNSTRKSKSLKPVEELRITSNSNFGTKIKTRNADPVRRVRRVYRKRYNPEEVRRRLLERERSKQESTTDNWIKI